jgi:hypothetical protein
MGIGIRRRVPRRLRKTLGFLFWIVSGSVLFVTCCRMLWHAYTSHSIFLPLRRTGRWVILEQEPGFFWTSVTLYAVLLLCAPVGVAAWTGELIGQLRRSRNKRA